MFEHKVAVTIGGAKGIGKAVAAEFRRPGTAACVIGLLPNDSYGEDPANQALPENFARKVLADHGYMDCLVNNALPLRKAHSKTARSF